MDTEQKASLVIEYIKTYIKNTGYSPSYREIGKALQIKSTSSVKGYIDKLRKTGLLKKEQPGKKRVLSIEA